MAMPITTARDAIATLRSMSEQIERVRSYLVDHTDARGPDAFWLGMARANADAVQHSLLMTDVMIGKTVVRQDD